MASEGQAEPTGRGARRPAMGQQFSSDCFYFLRETGNKVITESQDWGEGTGGLRGRKKKKRARTHANSVGKRKTSREKVFLAFQRIYSVGRKKSLHPHREILQ